MAPERKRPELCRLPDGRLLWPGTEMGGAPGGRNLVWEGGRWVNICSDSPPPKASKPVFGIDLCDAVPLTAAEIDSLVASGILNQ